MLEQGRAGERRSCALTHVLALGHCSSLGSSLAVCSFLVPGRLPFPWSAGQAAVLDMPSPWAVAGTDAVYIAEHLLPGVLVESEHYNSEGNSQGHGIYLIKRIGSAVGSYTEVFADLLAVEDDYYHWWLAHGEGRPADPGHVWVPHDAVDFDALASASEGGWVLMHKVRFISYGDVAENLKWTRRREGLVQKIGRAVAEWGVGSESRQEEGRKGAPEKQDVGPLLFPEGSERVRPDLGNTLKELEAKVAEGAPVPRSGATPGPPLRRERPVASGSRRRRRRHGEGEADNGAGRRRSRSTGQEARGAGGHGKSPRRKERKRRRSPSQRPRGSPQRSRSCSSSDHSSVFRLASSSNTRRARQRLLEFSRRKPGRLAARLLSKMAGSVQVEGEASCSQSHMPAVAKAFLLRVLLVRYPQMGPRNQASCQLLATILDHLASGRREEAMDVAAQELKAIERALQDESWHEAQFLRLLDDRVFTLLDDEDHALVAAETRDREKLRPTHQTVKGKYKGGWKGKDRAPALPMGEWAYGYAAYPGEGKGKPNPWADAREKGADEVKGGWKGQGKPKGWGKKG